jgi:hypothetical protein
MAEEQKRRSNAPFVIGLVGLLGTVPIAWKLFLSGNDPVKPPPAVVVVADAGHDGPVTITLSEVQGEVEIRDANADGGWRPAKQGDELKSSAGVRTKDGAVAVMAGGERWEVRIEPGTEVEVGELSDSISRLLLANGMAHAKVKGGNRFEVKATEGDAVARTDGGVFSISHNGAGTVAVGTEEGEVEFLGKGKVVIVRAGQGSIIKPGQAPTDPTPLPSSLLLKVALPATMTTNKPKVIVTGQVTPGSHVLVSGRNAPVDAEGKFKVPIVLGEGKHTIDVKAVGVGNQNAESKHAYEIDTRVKATTVKVPWDKKR